jgi:hypothetical protein
LKTKKPKLKLPTEHEIQSCFFDWVGLQSHEALKYLTFAVPNGSYKSRAACAKFQREGLKPGVSDVIVLYPSGRGGGHPNTKECWHGLVIEFKRPNGKLSEHQRTFLLAAGRNGFATLVAYDAMEAIAAVKSYLGIGGI